MEQKDQTSDSTCGKLGEIIKKCHDFGVKFEYCSNEDEKSAIISAAKSCIDETLEILQDPSNPRLAGIQILEFAAIMNSITWWPSEEERKKIYELLARVLTFKWDSEEISGNNCCPISIRDLAVGFTKWHRHYDIAHVMKIATIVVAKIIIIEYRKSKLDCYTLSTMSAICNAFSLVSAKNDYKSRIEVATGYMAMKIIMLQERNELHDNTGELLAPMAKSFNLMLKRVNYHIFIPAFVSIAKHFIQQFNHDKLHMLAPIHLASLARNITVRLSNDNEEGILKSVIVLFAKSLLLRSMDALCEFDSGILVSIMYSCTEWLMFDDEETTIKSLIMKVAESLDKQVEIKKLNLSSWNIKFLTRIAAVFNMLSEQEGNKCLELTMFTVANLTIEKHQLNQLRYLEVSKLGHLAEAFSKWHGAEHPNYFDTKIKAILSVARSFITKYKLIEGHIHHEVTYSKLINCFGLLKEYDDKQRSLRCAVEIISNLLLDHYKFVQLSRYSLEELCLLTNGFVKWYDDLPYLKGILVLVAESINLSYSDFHNLRPDILATLAQDLINFCVSDDEESLVFSVCLCGIAKALVKTYGLNELQEYNLYELSCLTSAFGKLFGKDDEKKSLTRAILCIAKKFNKLEYSDNVVLEDLVNYLHIFSYAFRIWNKDDDEQRSLHFALIFVEELICIYFEENNLNEFTVIQLSVLSQAIRKLAKEDGSLDNGCLAIAKCIVQKQDSLLQLNSEFLAVFAKTFSLWYENDDEGSFKRASEAVAVAMIEQLKDKNYAKLYSFKHLASLAFSLSKWNKCTGEQYLQQATIVIATYVNNSNLVNELSSLRLKDLAKLAKACSYWSQDSAITKFILDIAMTVNALDKYVLAYCDHAYLPYFVNSFSNFLNSFDQGYTKCIILAISNIIKAHNTQELKIYDKQFLSYLDKHFSKFFEKWVIHEATLIIRQEIGSVQAIHGRTVLEIFELSRRMGQLELSQMLIADPGTLSVLAISCSSFLHLDDANKSLRSMIANIAEIIYKYPKDLIILFDKEWLSNLVTAFCRCSEETAVQKAMSVLSKIITEYGAEAIAVFHFTLLQNITRSLRNWCDNFPSREMTEFDNALEYVTDGLREVREIKQSAVSKSNFFLNSNNQE